MGIGEQIKAARLKQGLTQKQLGELCGMADSAIRRYESDRGNPTEKTIQRIALALNMEPWELRGYDGSIRVSISPEQREYSKLMKKNADGTITEAELRRLGKLQAERPPLEESLKKLTGTLERIKAYLAPLNDAGQQKVVDQAEAYARDLAKIPEYQREQLETTPQSAQVPKGDAETAPQPSEKPQAGTDTTLPLGNTEGPQKDE